MTYTLTDGDSVTRDADGASIPTDPENRDYREYLAWVAKGNTATPAPSAAPAPTTNADKSRAIDKLAATADLTAAESVAIFGDPA